MKKSNAYKYAIRFYRDMWRTKYCFCFRHGRGRNECELKHKCWWFHSPENKSLYTKERGHWNVIITSHEILQECYCSKLPYHRVRILIEWMKKAEKALKENDHES